MYVLNKLSQRGYTCMETPDIVQQNAVVFFLILSSTTNRLAAVLILVERVLRSITFLMETPKRILLLYP